MKKVLSILCCIVLLFCVAACGKEPEPAAEPSTESIPVSSNTLISTEPQKPYWDTHEPLSYAGIYNGQRFSGDYEIASYDKTKEGDAYFKLPRLEGKVEDVAQQFLVRKETITDPFLDIYYDKKNNRYVDAWQTGYRMDKDGYPEFDFKTTTYYYSNTSCTIPGSDGWSYIEADDEYVVYVDGPKKAEEENKLHTRIYWKKGAGLLGFYRYSPSLDGGGAYVTNVRFTSKTADGWNMAETIVPNALPGAKRVWPEKLWPADYKGLNDPELRAILEEY